MAKEQPISEWGDSMNLTEVNCVNFTKHCSDCHAIFDDVIIIQQTGAKSLRYLR